MKTSSTWKTGDAVELYGVKDWGESFFDVDEKGTLVVRPCSESPGLEIPVMDVVSGLKARGLDMPILLRFSDILNSRISALNKAFQNAMRETGYRNVYRGVYPIKVNQQQQVVDEIVGFGRKYHYGLEAGSKAELIAALAYLNDPEAYLVCNGYKDEEFIDLALYGLKIGIQVVIVVEMPGEIPLILERSRKMGLKPLLGVRAKLSTRGEGYWTDSGGDRSTFGLTASEVIQMVDTLKDAGFLDCLKMLHFHLGSQIPNIRSIREAVSEACRFYVDMVKEGAPMGLLDVGGGLAVDYDGSHTSSPCSSNYSIEEYAADIVELVIDVTDQSGVEHPVLITESGRATVAHHSLLLFNTLDVTRFGSPEVPNNLPKTSHDLLINLKEILGYLSPERLQECYHDAVYYRDEVRSRFEHGELSLRERAVADNMVYHILLKIVCMMGQLPQVPVELKDLKKELADVYHVNFSVFQSLPDSWAINQLFPIMPIHRLNEEPVRQATLSDITCDCDGHISQFIDHSKVRPTLPLHAVNGEDYFLGVFLVGAYQETLGDLHNLLGDTNVVGVRIDDEGVIEFDTEIAGDTVADVLSYVEYTPSTMVDRLRKSAEGAVRSGRITPQERRMIMSAYQDGLRGYTYYEN